MLLYYFNPNIMHLDTILPTIGYLGIFLIVFAESGLFLDSSYLGTVCYSQPDS